MLFIETSGSYYEMGKQLGQRFSGELASCVDRFVGIIAQRGAAADVAADRVRATVECYSPQLLEETTGIADGSGIPEGLIFRNRFYGNIMALTNNGCSAFCVIAEDGAPWLGRTCDIEEGDHWSQICQIHRPTDGCATLTMSYLGSASGIGINEHGFGIATVSAPARDTYGNEGVFSSLLVHRVLAGCTTVAEADELLLGHPILCKGQVWLGADAAGGSCLYMLAPGREIEAAPRPAAQAWQVCTNFFPRSIPGTDDPLRLYNSYARYGWLVHQVGERQAEYTAAGLQGVLRGVSQPGPNIPKGSFPLETAYAQLHNLKTGTSYIAGGNPNSAPFQEFSLMHAITEREIHGQT